MKKNNEYNRESFLMYGPDNKMVEIVFDFYGKNSKVPSIIKKPCMVILGEEKHRLDDGEPYRDILGQIAFKDNEHTEKARELLKKFIALIGQT